MIHEAANPETWEWESNNLHYQTLSISPSKKKSQRVSPESRVFFNTQVAILQANKTILAILQTILNRLHNFSNDKQFRCIATWVTWCTLTVTAALKCEKYKQLPYGGRLFLPYDGFWSDWPSNGITCLKQFWSVWLSDGITCPASRSDQAHASLLRWDSSTSASCACLIWTDAEIASISIGVPCIPAKDEVECKDDAWR